MEEKNDQKLLAEKLIDLEEGLSLWKIGIDRLREQDINANVQPSHKFRLLQNTIKRDKRLESVPFVVRKNIDDREEFWIVSGHHRVRGARMAGKQYIFCLVDEREYPMSKIRAKQMAHNAIHGTDDEQILLQMFKDMENDLQAQQDSGVDKESLLKGEQGAKIDEMELEIQTQIVSLVFTRKGYKDFEDTIKQVNDSDTIGVVDVKYFDEFVQIARKVSTNEDIRNMTGIVAKMLEIVRGYYKTKEEIEKVAKKMKK